jgi:hypothetical protein
VRVIEDRLDRATTPPSPRFLWAALRGVRALDREPGTRLLDAARRSEAWWVRTSAEAIRHAAGSTDGSDLADLLATPTSCFRRAVQDGERRSWLDAIARQGRLDPLPLEELLGHLFSESVAWQEVLYDEFSLGPGTTSRIRERFDVYLRRRHEILDLLRGKLASADASVRRTALRALGRFGGRPSLRGGVFLLHDPDADVRNLALRMLREVSNIHSDLGFDPDRPPTTDENRQALARWEDWERTAIDTNVYVWERMIQEVRESLAREGAGWRPEGGGR